MKQSCDQFTVEHFHSCLRWSRLRGLSIKQFPPIFYDRARVPKGCAVPLIDNYNHKDVFLTDTKCQEQSGNKRHVYCLSHNFTHRWDLPAALTTHCFLSNPRRTVPTRKSLAETFGLGRPWRWWLNFLEARFLLNLRPERPVANTQRPVDLDLT